jgi:hypothetical protein
MQTTQGSLVLVGLNTNTPQVFWNGQIVGGITGIQVNNNELQTSVVFKMNEDPVIAEMKAAGITVKRGLV